MTAITVLDAFVTAAADVPGDWRTYDGGLYGADIICTDDTDALFSEDDGTTAVAVAYVVWRTVTSDRGSIPDAPGEGIDLRAMLRKGATVAAQRLWPSLLQAEILRDERVATVAVRFTQVDAETWQIAIDGTTANDEPFDLVGLLSPTTSILKQIMGATA